MKHPTTFTVKSVAEFVDVLSSLRDYYRQRNEYTGEQFSLFYRGQANSSWGLVPNLFRKVFPSFHYKKETRFSELENEKAKLFSALLRDEARKSDSSYFSYEAEIIAALKNKYPKVITQDMDNLDVLTFIQHFGGKTRLLDITSDALVALYFATSTESRNNGIVFAIPVMRDELNASLIDRAKLNLLSNPQIYRSRDLKSANKKFHCNLKARISNLSSFRLGMLLNDKADKRDVSSCSRINLRRGGFLPSPSRLENALITRIIVKAIAKKRIQSELDWFFGLREQTLFPEDMTVAARDVIDQFTHTLKNDTGYLVDEQP